VNCILQWSMVKECCPQCKQPFDYLLTHKQLDGTLTDYLAEESVVLLKRARWFEEYLRVRACVRVSCVWVHVVDGLAACVGSMCWRQKGGGKGGGAAAASAPAPLKHCSACCSKHTKHTKHTQHTGHDRTLRRVAR
jgi:hypothetical protein